ncbi:MAG: SUMF1/EgtB/PvdO family nonheme iron enzyme [Planctomycetes bacterium]|nr:SUMF1/EgtB/PvdO family nonheme iron enzyme [Planctomycetota bacterium]
MPPARANSPPAPIDPDADNREGPVHLVTLAAFLIGKHEVHQAAWQRMTGANPSRHRPSPERWRDGFHVHAPIDALAANPFGLMHMLGNVREWCLDTLQSYALPVRPGDGARQIGENTKLRVTRGGHFADPASACRSAGRAQFAPGDAANTAGLRAVIEIPD